MSEPLPPAEYTAQLEACAVLLVETQETDVPEVEELKQRAWSVLRRKPAPRKVINHRNARGRR